MSDVLRLDIDGKSYGGWQSARVTRGLERAVSDFSLTVTERWPGTQEAWRIPEGAVCALSLGDDLVLTGYVDRVEAAYDDRSHRVTVTGRSRTQDLVDCSAPGDGGEIAGRTLYEVARGLAQPFGIDVRCDPAEVGAAFPSLQVQQGDTAFQVIEKAARQRSLLATDAPDGALEIVRLASERADDELRHPAESVKAISGFRSLTDRFSAYVVKGQATRSWLAVDSKEPVDGAPEALAHVIGGVVDPGVPRYRPKVIVADGATNTGGAQQRAEWEARRRFGRSRQVKVRRAGWRQSSGALWRPNLLVMVTVPFLDLEEDMAIAETTWSLDASGAICELLLMPPAGLTPEPLEPATGVGVRWGDVTLNSGRLPA